MTIGEIARLCNDHFGIDADLDVVAMAGWRRDMYWDASGLPWVLPSPNIPTVDSAVVYPGTVLFEGTNVSEGRGTTRPFEIVGAPWIGSESFAAAMNGLDLPGVRFRPVVFEPTFHKHAGISCGGCQIHVLDRTRFRAVETGVALLCAFRAADPERFCWRNPPYEYEREKLPFDILAGSSELREQIERATPAGTIARSWEVGVQEFTRVRERYCCIDDRATFDAARRDWGLGVGIANTGKDSAPSQSRRPNPQSYATQEKGPTARFTRRSWQCLALPPPVAWPAPSG
jgi:uncharacterized protein YbbC (DUF1343 family)